MVVLSTVAAVTIAVPAAAGADGPWSVQHLLAPDGGPLLTGNPAPATSGPVRWRACAPDCGAVVAEGPTFAPGPTVPGTTFEASTTSGDGSTAAVRSRPWTGPVAAAAPPTVRGEVRIGRVFAAVAGTWTGGWGDDRSVTGLRACRTREGTDCRLLGAGDVFATASDARRAIDPAFAGWFVGAYEQRYAQETAFPAVAPAPDPVLGTPVDRRPPFTATGTPTSSYGPLVGPVPPSRTGTPPRVVGRLAVGRRVTPRPGTWPDAPDGGRIASAVRACPTRRDTPRCVLLNGLEAGGGLPDPGTAVRLGTRHLGWYLGAVDRHRPADAVVPGPTDSSADASRAVPAPDLVTVLGPLSAEPVGLGFTPRASVPPRATLRRGVLRLATIRCVGRCVARVTVRGAGRRVPRRIAVRAGRAVTVAERRSRFGSATTVRVTVRFDHSRTVARRTVRLP